MSQGIFSLPRNTQAPGLIDTPTPQVFGLAGKSLSAKPGCLYQAACVNKGATAYFVQLHDKATAPVATDVPVWEGVLPANGEWKVDFSLLGKFFANGIAVAISTTAGVLTLAAANDAVLYARYTSAG